MKSLFDTLVEQSRHASDRVAIEQGGCVTYGRFADEAQAVGRRLQDVGEEHESAPVAVCAGHGRSMLTGLFGAWSAGRVAVPLDAELPEDILRERLLHSGASVVVGDDDTLPAISRISDGPSRIISIEECLNSRDSGENGDSHAPLGEQQDLAVILYTSGTTGRPKGVLHAHESLRWNALNHVRMLDLSPSDRGLLLAKASTISGLTDALRILFSGGTLVPFDLADGGLTGLRSRLAESAPTIVHLVPTIFRRLLRSAENGDSAQSRSLFNSVRVLHLGGELVTRRDFEAYQQAFRESCVLFHNLGCTEVPSFRYTLFDKTSTPPDGPLPLQRDAAGKAVELREPSSGVLPDRINVSGEIVVRTRYAATGYWRDDPLTSQRFESQPEGDVVYHTGDVGQWTAGGALIHQGRMDDTVKILGRSVNLAAIEATLQSNPDVRDVAVIAANNDQQTRLLAFCSCVPSMPANALRTSVAESLPYWQVPEVILLDALPTLVNGKIDRSALKTLAETNCPRPEHADLDGPRTPTEEKLTAICEQVLGRNSIRRSDSFAAVGGDSLSAVDLLHAINVTFGRRLQLRDFAAQPSISQLATLIDAADSTEACSAQANGTVSSRQSTGQYLEIWRVGPNPIVVVGYSLTAQAVLEHLSPDRGIVLLKLPGLHDSSVRFPTIARSIRLFWSDLTLAGIEAPSAIVGFSYGGLLAFALALEYERLGTAPPITLLLEPATPNRALSRLHSVNSPAAPRILQYLGHSLRRLSSRSHWKTMLRYGRLLISKKLGYRLSWQQKFGGFRFIIRRNRNLYEPVIYGGEVLLIGSKSYLTHHTRTWRSLVSGEFDVLTLPGGISHIEITQPATAMVWTASLQHRRNGSAPRGSRREAPLSEVSRGSSK